MPFECKVNGFYLLVSFFVAINSVAGHPVVGPYESFHAFEHLHSYSMQAKAAADSDATVIYATGLGLDGYSGLPPAEVWKTHQEESQHYVAYAKSLGIRVVLGYLCATSIVGLEGFDVYWPNALKKIVATKPAKWLQQSSDGKALPSWYGGKYHPACMNHPDWRSYQKFMIQAQLATGHDGIFFDNPTVHPEGCYCLYCMFAFVRFLKDEGVSTETSNIEGIRAYALSNPLAFKRFRCTIARDFLSEMRAYARSINPNVIITANNSLNHRDVLFSQCHNYGYNLYEMSKSQDFVVIEDMSSQPRTLANGMAIESGPTYAQVHALIHGKPLVASTIAENDYHTPPNLVCLAMVEAAAYQTGYLLWSCWPQEQRKRMADSIAPYADWLKRNATLLKASRARCDVLVFLPFRQWIISRKCQVTDICQKLTQDNISYEVVCEDTFPEALSRTKRVILEDPTICTPMEQEYLSAFLAAGGKVIYASNKDWFDNLTLDRDGRSVQVEGTTYVRAVVRDTDKNTIVFLYNLNIERLSSFEDQIRPAEDVKVTILTPFQNIHAVHISGPEVSYGSGTLNFSVQKTEKGNRIETSIPRLTIGVLLVIDAQST